MYKISNMSFFEKSYNKWLKDYYGVVDSELDYWNCIGFLFEVKKNKKLDFNNKKDVKKYCKVIKEVWDGDIERYMNVKEKSEWLNKYLKFIGKENWKYLMDKDERKYLNELDDEIRVYRGINMKSSDWYCGLNEYNLSWSLEIGKGKWFSERFKDFGFDRCILLVGKVKKEDIWFYNSWRNEFEIVSDKVEYEKRSGEYYDDLIRKRKGIKKLSESISNSKWWNW